MLWLNILNNENFLLAAEILFIVIGSMLLGILLSYLSSSGMRTKVSELTVALEEEKKQALTSSCTFKAAMKNLKIKRQLSIHFRLP